MATRDKELRTPLVISPPAAVTAIEDYCVE